ncbi:hypothetical protein [Microbacterium sp. T2.11-28]|uniref:hypothetical protein n=1 Tax=Microbacterium sp. T2.11-28 TaxID=3041169 RepID=UPI0024773193|nr:hypothetical protein [Microbacterium sp. T2.11-28]CAI9392524.1 hypothetical protein MICABA_02137 [Microbacterium sp. T2.11-28]
MTGAGRRTANRLVLAALGIVGLGVAAIAIWPLIAPTLGGAPLPVDDTVADAVTATGLGVVAVAWILAAVASLVVLLAVLWAVGSRRGRSRSAVDADGIVVDTAVVEGIVRSSLAAAPDVLAVQATTYARRGQRLLRLKVQLRPRADLADAAGRVRGALADLDAALGIPLPAVVHLTTGIRTALARGRRVD